MFFNADWRVFEFDEEEMAKNGGSFVLKEDRETETRGGGMGRSEVGVFGVVDGDFPPEVEEEEAKTEGRVEGLEEVNKQKPSA
jgi:hypothetical protein